MWSKKEFVIILAITFVVIMVWIIADIAHSRPNKTLNPRIQTLIQPIEVNFDTETVGSVESNFSSRNSIPSFTQTPNPSSSPKNSPRIEVEDLDDLDSSDSALLDKDIESLSR